jgi:hypothetical protein
MLARSYRTAKHVVIAMTLLAALVLSTGVAVARPARHAARHRGVARHRFHRRHSHAAARRRGHRRHSDAAAANSSKRGGSSKKGSNHGGSTGGSKGSKGSKGSTGGSVGTTGGSTGGSTGAGSTGGAGGSTGAGSTGSGSTGSSGGSTGGAGGSTGGAGGSTGGAGGSTGGSTGSGWTPPQHLTWYWQLQGSVNNGEPVAAYDIDGFENTAAEVTALHAQGKRVICYIDVGTSENFRPDFSSFPVAVQGSSNGWPGEKWLNVADLSVLEPIMTARFEMCKEKGFDAVEPDNMDGYENSTGFSITAQQQLAYDEWVATEVHSLGMAVFQKNDGEQTGQLESYFDGALDEQCNQYSECSNFQAYLKAGKPVLNAEYSLSTSAFCTADNAAGIMGARYSLELNGTTFEPCWS